MLYFAELDRLKGIIYEMEGVAWSFIMKHCTEIVPNTLKCSGTFSL